jgi:phosphoribosyl 1,2-cyclic phosphate phosphodiesterase
MKITFLGTGTSQGVPVIGCNCAVCKSLDYRDKRLRVSVHIEVEGKSLVIDAGPDFRQQMLRGGINNLDAVILTHEHKDHIAGLDDIRAYNFFQQRDMPVYGHPRTLAQVKQEFYYAFAEVRYPGVPVIKLHEIDSQPFDIEGVTVIPIEVLHHKLPVLGYRIGNFSYITDVNYMSEQAIELVKGSDIVVLSALQQSPHISHYTLAEALEVLEKIEAKQAYLTHSSHRMGLHLATNLLLPDHIKLAYDGLVLNL